MIINVPHALVSYRFPLAVFPFKMHTRLLNVVGTAMQVWAQAVLAVAPTMN